MDVKGDLTNIMPLKEVADAKSSQWIEKFTLNEITTLKLE